MEVTAGRLGRVRALVIGHDHIGGTGHVGDALARAGWTLEEFTVVPEHRFTRPAVTVDYPDLSGWDLVLTLGAPWPRHAITTWAGREVTFLASAHTRGVPVLGVCAGAQFLAEALGGGSAPLPHPRVGWFPVKPVDEVVPPGPWFQWNSDRIIAPPGAEVLAESADGVEAFRVGSSVGVQFHPEMSADLLDRWLEADAGTNDADGRLRRESVLRTPGAAERARQLVVGLRLT